MDFAEFFRSASEYRPYPYQVRLAKSVALPKVLVAPTGADKTEAAILAAWLWRRLDHPDQSVRLAAPRRLVYCLPMRTLVEQTRDRIGRWLTKLGLSERIRVTVLMGGEEPDEWYLYPDQERIIIGTQDMLLSRALNRGYTSSPFRWPIEFGLLNSDCLWVFDEVQLMANGLPTSTQLQAFRQCLLSYGTCQTLWMSATIRPEWLHTVDFPAPSGDGVFTLGQDDLRFPELARRGNASKTLRKMQMPTKGDSYDSADAALQVSKLHRPGSKTLVVVNTVGRAQDLYDKLEQLKPSGELVLVHSRFRPPDRQEKTQRVLAPVNEGSPGRIVVATQAIEAGVDVSAHTLVTELAPWTSLVQRFGRCNRYGSDADAAVYWLDLPKTEKGAAPYDVEELSAARDRLDKLEGQSVAPASLPQLEDEVTHQAVLRRRDLLSLFDTTADLSGSYLDVSRFVRGTDETDVHVFWREFEGGPRPDMPTPARDELCSVPIGDIKRFLGSGSKSRRPSTEGRAEEEEDDATHSDDSTGESTDRPTGARPCQAWQWSHLFGQWEPVSEKQVYPGQTLLLRAADGGYTKEKGWDATSRKLMEVVPSPDTPPPESMGGEHSLPRQDTWVLLRDHSLNVRDEARRILEALRDLGLPEEAQRALLAAAQYHDWGKVHAVFQETMVSHLTPEEQARYKGLLWAKRGQAGQRPQREHERPHFRHELGSGLALLSSSVGLDGWAGDLVAYLVAAHHGKARLGLRSLPRVRDQGPDRYYLLGFRFPGDNTPQDKEELRQENTLPAADLGDGAITQELVIDLSPAQIGVSSSGERSWLDRTLDLLDRLGPFRLAYLEALIRAADVLASKAEQREAGNNG